MPHSFSNTTLRNQTTYSFQGQERDDEVKGAGNSVNYTFRMHDPRVGRFFAVDPLAQSYPELTPYQFSSNSPIYMIEIEGLEGKIRVITQWYTVKGIQKTKCKTYTVDGLKADLFKVCWKGSSDGTGPVTSIDYYGMGEDGSRLGGLTRVDPDAKPSVKELNAIFANDAMNSYNIKEKEKEAAATKKENERWYDGTVFAPGALEGGDDGFNTGNNSSGKQAPWPAKVIAGINPLVSVPNAISVLTTNTDIYGVNSSTKTDKVLAGLSLIGAFGGFTKIAALTKASDKVIKVTNTVDKANTVVQVANDAGALDKIK